MRKRDEKAESKSKRHDDAPKEQRKLDVADYLMMNEKKIHSRATIL